MTPIICPTCNGEGVELHRARGFSYVATCSDCRGSGAVLKDEGDDE